MTACTHASVAHKRPGDWCPWACGTQLTADHIRAANAWHERPQVATVGGEPHSPEAPAGQPTASPRGPGRPPGRQSPVPLADRLWSMVDKTDGCWLWTGALSKGYGMIDVKDDAGTWRHKKAHRVAYELAVGPIPDGLVIDHLCRNPCCVNPEHLEPVTQQENSGRGNTHTGRPRRADHCHKGHPYDEENTIHRVTDGYEWRDCRACRRGDPPRPANAAPVARISDPATAHQAARTARTRAVDRRRAVLLAHANAHDGLTGEELATVLREPYSTVGPRRPALVADGLLVHMPFDSRPNVAGNPMDVYRVTAKGRTEAARLSAGAA